MKRNMVMIGLVFMFCLLLGMGKTEQVQAASYQMADLSSGQSEKVGKTTFEYVSGSYGYDYLYATRNGNRCCIFSGKYMNSTIITNGTTVYYSVDSYYNASKSTKPMIYRVRYDGKKRRKIFQEKYAYLWMEGYYNGKIYYVTGDGIDGDFCSYSLKNGKKKKLARYVTIAKQYGQYFLLSPADGDYGPCSLQVYDAKKGKLVTISNKKLNYAVISGKLYYVEGSYYGSWDSFNVSVKKCNLGGGSKKTLVKNLKITGVVKIRKNSITYYDLNGKKKMKKF